MAEERSFKPSRRKIEKARAEGRVLKSSLVTHAVQCVVLLALLKWLGGRIWVGPKMLLEYRVADSPSGLAEPVLYSGLFVFQAVILVLGVCAGTALVVDFAQVGFRVESKPLAPRVDRLNPANGLKRIGTGLLQVWEPALRVMLVGITGWILMRSALPDWASLQGAEQGVVLREGSRTLFPIMIGIAAAAAVAGAFDYLLRRRGFFRELSMSHEEVREELKEQEGSPLMRALRRAMHERIAMQDLEQRVRRSKVIVVRKAEPR